MSHPKVTLDDLKAVFDTVLEDTNLQAFIDDAHLFIDDVLSGKGLSADRLTQIEKYWAAGQAELRDPRADSSRAAGQQVNYLQSTYLQRAVQLDTTGTLKRLMKDDRVEFASTVRAGAQDPEASVSDETDEY